MSSAAASQRTVMSLPEKLVTLRSDGGGTFTRREEGSNNTHILDFFLFNSVFRLCSLNTSKEISDDTF